MTWGQHVELLPVRDKRLRAQIEKQAVKKVLSVRQIRQLVREANQDARLAKALPPLARPADLRLNTFRKTDPAIAALRNIPRGQVLVDCGFFVLRPVEEASLEGLLTDKPAYTYAATVERVIDGDTLLVLIDAGFGSLVHERLRLRGINTPELGTPDGEKAKKYLTKLLPAGSDLVIKSYRTDDYGRFVADVLYKNGMFDPQQIIDSGTYLNQQLLDEGYAVRMSE